MKIGIIFSIIGLSFLLFASLYMSYLTSSLIRSVLVFPVTGLGIVLIVYGIIMQKSYQKSQNQRIKRLTQLGIILILIEVLMSVLFFVILFEQASYVL